MCIYLRQKVHTVKVGKCHAESPGSWVSFNSGGFLIPVQRDVRHCFFCRLSGACRHLSQPSARLDSITPSWKQHVNNILQFRSPLHQFFFAEQCTKKDSKPTTIYHCLCLTIFSRTLWRQKNNNKTKQNKKPPQTTVMSKALRVKNIFICT